MTGPERAARKSDLFGRDPEFAPEGDGEAPPPPTPFPGHHHARESDCAYCPICGAIAIVRNAKPEVMEHLASAARELLAAAAMLVEEAGKVVAAPSSPDGSQVEDDEPPPPNVRRLDLS